MLTGRFPSGVRWTFDPPPPLGLDHQPPRQRAAHLPPAHYAALRTKVTGRSRAYVAQTFDHPPATYTRPRSAQALHTVAGWLHCAGVCHIGPGAQSVAIGAQCWPPAHARRCAAFQGSPRCRRATHRARHAYNTTPLANTMKQSDIAVRITRTFKPSGSTLIGGCPAPNRHPPGWFGRALGLSFFGVST